MIGDILFFEMINFIFVEFSLS